MGYQAMLLLLNQQGHFRTNQMSKECLANSDSKETLPGEKVLLDTKESRGYETRLREIEQQLGHLDTELQSGSGLNPACVKSAVFAGDSRGNVTLALALLWVRDGLFLLIALQQTLLARRLSLGNHSPLPRYVNFHGIAATENSQLLKALVAKCQTVEFAPDKR
ncbi:UNVERIFIED_CONTAM: hypothetical protein FKN15_018348 [Acipenser sinensis]